MGWGEPSGKPATETHIMVCGPCWRDSRSSPLPPPAWRWLAEVEEGTLEELICPIHGQIAVRGNFGTLDLGIVRGKAAAAGSDPRNDFSLFFSEFGLPTGDGREGPL